MKKEQIGLLVWILLLVFTVSVHSQDAAKVSLVNAGKMYVSSSGAANIYVLGGVRMINGVMPVNIVQQGVTKLTGHFYQDCTNGSHVFATDAAGIGTSTGTITFFGEAFDKEITTKTLTAFNRQGSYIAFPNVQIDMNKNLILPSRMAADMNKLVVGAGKVGKLWLKSANDASAAPGRIYDASLRFPKRATTDTDNTTTQSTNAPLGKIVVERDILGYRGNTTPQGVMFPFATPFYGTQRSGYFAGNWVHRPVRDASHHTEYPYGNIPDPATGKIARNQFITDPLEKLVAGQAYLIKPLGTTEFPGLVLNYELALQITGAGAPTVSDYQKTMFVFDGSVYKLPKEDEQLNLMPIFDKTVSSVKGKAVRILIGNSYTAPLDLQKISLYLYNHPTLYISRNIQVFLPHQTSYIPYDILQHIPGKVTAPQLMTKHTVPGMGVFMIILHDGYNSTGNLKIDRTFLTHDNNPHNLRSANGFQDEVLFTLTSEYYSLTEDLAAIGFRTGAKETKDDLDMLKAKPENLANGPVMYTLSDDNMELASNSIPEGTKNVRLCIESNNRESDRCRLHISRHESLNTGCLMLEDRATRSFIDLKDLEYYDFTLYPGDSKDRFVVHFTLPTDINDMNTQALTMFYNKQSQTLEVKGLTEKDINSSLTVTDTQGRILRKEDLKESHEVNYLIEGVYIAKITGERSVVLKFVK